MTQQLGWTRTHPVAAQHKPFRGQFSQDDPIIILQRRLPPPNPMGGLSEGKTGRKRKGNGFAPSVPLLLPPREDVGLCQEAELDWSAGVLVGCPRKISPSIRWSRPMRSCFQMGSIVSGPPRQMFGTLPSVPDTLKPLRVCLSFCTLQES
ncbi:hypothetical protein D4764_18G0008400 [Takifugu flavidus]|uniref:Uncharacterized protein n=1 Tax=Takifugu flavidus TaxID=433684 RepID=A0A5C6NRI0_9TELE|nr:hypothetical protein D4764_18G0008400 [Takifugu flavidus]